MRKILIFAALVVVLATPAYAADIVARYVPQSKPVGQARLTYLMWDVYDAVLYAPRGTWDGKRPFALQLTYLLDLKGAKIADRSIVEIRRQRNHDPATLERWRQQLRAIIPDVKKGESLTGVYARDGKTIFYRGAERLAVIDDPEFGPAFFGIWLGEATSEPKLRRKLLARI